MTGQSLCGCTWLWRSGQELRNNYTITRSPDFAPLRRFLKAAVDQLQLLHDDMPVLDFSTSMAPARSLIDTMKDKIYQSSVSSGDTRGSPVEYLVVEESPVGISPSLSTDYDAVSLVPDFAPVRSLTPTNWSLRFLETGAPGSPLTHELSSHAAVPGMCIVSTDLLSYIDPLPMDKLALHDSRTVRDWPTEDRKQLLAVAHRDLHVTRRNVADLTRYLDEAAQLAMCAGAGEDNFPLMTVETFPRLTGGVRAILDSTQH